MSGVRQWGGEYSTNVRFVGFVLVRPCLENMEGGVVFDDADTRAALERLDGVERVSETSFLVVSSSMPTSERSTG